MSVNRGHYYFDNYQYTLQCNVNIDATNSIVIQSQTMQSPNQYIFTKISDAIYNMLENGTVQINSIDVIATDCTGLKHICKVVGSISRGQWYTHEWRLNIPDGIRPSVNTCGIIDNSSYVDSKEYTYLSGTQNIVIPNVFVSPNFNYKFEGWLDGNQIVVDENGNPTTLFPQSITSNKVFTAKFTIKEQNE